jgi:trehalose synthase
MVIATYQPTRVFEVPAIPYPGPPLPALEPSEDLAEALSAAQAALDGHTVWQVNSTCGGGGVAELLYAFLRRHNELGIPTRWLVAGASAEFFAVTKRLYYKLYGTDEDTAPLSAAERDLYGRTTKMHALEALQFVSPGDIVVLHDPQTLGMAETLVAAGVRVIWQCHLGCVDPNPWTSQVWEFLGDDLFAPDGYVFCHPRHVYDALDPSRVRVILPAIDPASPKNRPLAPDQVTALLYAIGLGSDPGPQDLADAEFGREAGWMSQLAMVDQRIPLPPDKPLVLQVSRWDTLKDQAGVLTAFAEVVAPGTDAHLVLVGPDPAAIADDPGGTEVFAAIREATARLPDELRDRIHLVCTRGDDLEGTAFLINALQRRADIVTQKSIKESFGLTITEAMLKAKPVVAPDVGAISEQVVDGRTGLLVADPLDLEVFGQAVWRLLAEPGLRERLAAGAVEHCTRRFLIDRQLTEYARFYADLITAELPAGCDWAGR